MHRKATSGKKTRRRGGVLGLGLDATDGHRRITKGEDFLLLGGSPETHERMTELVLRMKERLKAQGKTFGDLTREEFENLSSDSVS